MKELPPVSRTHLVVGAAAREVYDVVVDWPNYPRFFRELKSVAVLATEGARVRAEFRGQIIIPVRYVLDLICDPQALTVDWTFVEGEIVSDSRGGWKMTDTPGGALAQYRASLAVNAPLPAMVVRKITDTLLQASLPGMFTALEREVGERRRTRG